MHTPALCINDGLGFINNEVDPVFTGTFGIIIFYRYSSPRITSLRFPDPLGSPRSSGVQVKVVSRLTIYKILRF